MLVNRPNITEKTYRKLNVSVRQDGFAFCTIDTLNDRALVLKDIRFPDNTVPGNLSEAFSKAIALEGDLSQKFDLVTLIYANGLNTFVPKALFDEQFRASYLQYNVKVFESDAVAFDELHNYEMVNVYLTLANVNDLLSSRFGQIDQRHSGSILVQKLLDASRNIEEKQVFAHFDGKRFDLVVVQNQKLLLFNSFEFRTKEDFIYYLLFACEQLNLNPEFFRLQLLGDISAESDCFQIAYTYVRNVSLMDVSKLRERNDFSEADNLRHFTLLQS